MLCELSLTVGFKTDPNIDSIPISSKLLEHCFKNRGRHGGGFARAAHWIYPPPPRSGWSGVCESRVKVFVKFNLSNPSRKGSRGSAARAQMAAPARVPIISHSLFRLQLAMLTHFWSSLSSSFCHHSSNMFFNRFLVHFGSQNASQILPKSIQKLDLEIVYFSGCF